MFNVQLRIGVTQTPVILGGAVHRTRVKSPAAELQKFHKVAKFYDQFQSETIKQGKQKHGRKK